MSSATQHGSPTPEEAPGDNSSWRSGMTCASCANRIERKLNRLDGVTATVNYATEKARVSFADKVSPHLVSTVEAPGQPAQNGRRGHGRRRAGCECRGPDPVAARPAAGLGHALRTGHPAGDGARAAVHLLAVALPDPGRAGRGLGRLAVPPIEFTISRTDGSGNIYLKAAAGVTTFILAGRYFEARSKRRAGTALRALLELGAKEVSVLCEGPDGRTDERIRVEQLAVGDLFVVRPGEKIATDGVIEQGTSAVDASGSRGGADRRLPPAPWVWPRRPR